ncbi:MAG: hypothetical protein ABIQ31_18585 [Ferruginibacter sp.]
MKILPIVLGGTALYFIAKTGLNTAQALKRLSYTNPKVKFKKISLLGIELELTLDIVNPASADIPLDYFTGQINYAGKNISSFTFNANGKNTIIKARGITTVPFTINIKNIATISTLVKIANDISSPAKTVSPVFDIAGSLFAAGFDVPVNFQYDLKTNSVASGIVTGVGALSIKDIRARKEAAKKLHARSKAIAGVKATLEFASNGEMEKYFFNKKANKKLVFSKN